MKISENQKIELLQLIEGEKQAYRDKVNGNGAYEAVVELCRIIDDPDTPLWQARICTEIMTEPSPVINLIARLGMGEDSVESVRAIELYAH